MSREGLMLREIVRVGIRRAIETGGYMPEIECEGGDLIPNSGRIFLARRISGFDTANSPMRYMAIGTAVATPALGDTTLPGEIKRKASGVYSAQANNLYTNICTFGGAADSVQSIQIAEAGIFNHANSGFGTLFQRVTFPAVTLANSDILRLTLETLVGSNTI